MSRKSVQRFCGDDMGQNKDLKRDKQIRRIATRFQEFHLSFQVEAGRPD
jgi:hypothetical protein